jgi:hypothetical protein
LEELLSCYGSKKKSREGDETLRDHCMIAYRSGYSDVNAHSHNDLPILLAGGGCGTPSAPPHSLSERNPLERRECSLSWQEVAKVDP